MAMALSRHPHNRSDPPSGQDLLITLLRTELYPEEIFPRTLFPTLERTLRDHFLKTIQGTPPLANAYHKGGDTAALRDSILETLKFQTLLEHHPQVVILIYKPAIARFLAMKHVRAQERPDLLQEIIARLLGKNLARIKKRYDFNFKNLPTFTSYLLVTVRNIYIDIMRERNNPMYRTDAIDIVENRQGEDARPFDQHLIQEEKTKLRLLLNMYYRSRGRIELCLKLKYRILITPNEVRRCFPKATPEDIRVLTRDFRSLKDREVFNRVIPIFNKHDGKQSQSDTLRKWIAIKSDEIMAHLNRTHTYTVYRSDVFADLVSLYYQSEVGKV